MASARDEAKWEADSIKSGLKVPAKLKTKEIMINKSMKWTKNDWKRGKCTLTEEEIVPGKIQIRGRSVRHLDKCVANNAPLLLGIDGPAEH